MEIIFKTDSDIEKIKKSDVIIIGQCGEYIYDDPTLNKNINKVINVSGINDVVRLFDANNDIYSSYMHFYSADIKYVSIIPIRKFKTYANENNYNINEDILYEDFCNIVDFISSSGYAGICVIAGYNIDVNFDLSRNMINFISTKNTNCVFMFSTSKANANNFEQMKSILDNIKNYNYDGINHKHSLFVVIDNTKKSIIEYNNMKYEFNSASYVASIFLSKYPKNAHDMVLYFNECNDIGRNAPFAFFKKRSDGVVRLSNTYIYDNSIVDIYTIKKATCEISNAIELLDINNIDVYDKINNIIDDILTKYNQIIVDHETNIYCDFSNSELIITIDMYVNNVINVIYVTLSKTIA